MHHGHLRRHLIAIETLGQYGWGLGPKGMLTTTAFLVVETIEDLLGGGDVRAESAWRRIKDSSYCGHAEISQRVREKRI